jgi:hypothetical protein
MMNVPVMVPAPSRLEAGCKPRAGENTSQIRTIVPDAVSGNAACRGSWGSVENFAAGFRHAIMCSNKPTQMLAGLPLEPRRLKSGIVHQS